MIEKLHKRINKLANDLNKPLWDTISSQYDIKIFRRLWDKFLDDRIHNQADDEFVTPLCYQLKKDLNK